MFIILRHYKSEHQRFNDYRTHIDNTIDTYHR
nr:MAG TPA: hypothetical protein [Caudoviricetes sp.]